METTIILIESIIFLLGISLMETAYKGAFSRNKPDKQIEKYFKWGRFFVMLSMISFVIAFYYLGQGQLKTKSAQQETIFVVQKKLDNHKAEILTMDEGDKFVIVGDEVLYVPETEPEQAPNPSLSDVKKM